MKKLTEKLPLRELVKRLHRRNLQDRKIEDACLTALIKLSNDENRYANVDKEKMKLLKQFVRDTGRNADYTTQELRELLKEQG